MKTPLRILIAPALLCVAIIYQSTATTYIWGVPRKIVTIDDGINEIVEGPPPRATPRPGTPRPSTPRPSTPRPSTPRPTPPTLTAAQETTLAGNTAFATWAANDPASAMHAALAQPNRSHVMRVAQVWRTVNQADFEAWYSSLTDPELRKLISLAIPAKHQINPETQRQHPDFPQIAQTWAVFESEHDPARVRQFAATVDEPLRGLLLEIVEKVQP